MRLGCSVVRGRTSLCFFSDVLLVRLSLPRLRPPFVRSWPHFSSSPLPRPGSRLGPTTFYSSSFSAQAEENEQDNEATRPTTETSLSEYVRALPAQVEQARQRTKKKAVEDTMPWDQRLQQLLAYRREMNDFSPPVRSEFYPGLARWLVKQQSLQYLQKLDKDKEAQLAAIGLPWLGDRNHRMKHWWEHYEELKDYAKRFGHTRVPKLWEENVPLARWVQTQRSLFCARRLNFEKIHALDALHFDWKITTWQWNKNLENLQAFKRKYGHINVYRWKPAHAEPWINFWLKSKEGKAAKKRYKEELIEQLSNEQQEEAKAMLEGKEETEEGDDGDGDDDDIVSYRPAWEELIMTRTDIPDTDHDHDDYVDLASDAEQHERNEAEADHWLEREGEKEEEGKEKEDRMTAQRWSQMSSHARKQMIEEEIKKRELQREAEIVRKLRHWVLFQKKLYRAGQLKQVRMDSLRELGFNLSMSPRSGPEWWNRLNEAAEAIKTNPLLRGVATNQPELYSWINNTRYRYRVNNLSPRQRAAVEEAGIHLSKKNQWDLRFAALQEFQRVHGHTNPSRRDNPILWRWVVTQRHNRQKGRLTREHQEALDRLHFSWRGFRGGAKKEGKMTPKKAAQK